VPPILTPPALVGTNSGTAPASPVVESFMEKARVCKADDSLARICQEEYHDARYERALLMYNRSHPMAGEGIYSDPPALQAGQRVMLPPLNVLEKRFGQLIPGMPRPPAAPAAAPAPPAPAPTTWSSQAAGFRQYTVQGANETLYDIAKRNLGSGDRWSDIRALNPARRHAAGARRQTAASADAMRHLRVCSRRAQSRDREGAGSRVWRRFPLPHGRGSEESPPFGTDCHTVLHNDTGRGRRSSTGVFFCAAGGKLLFPRRPIHAIRLLVISRTRQKEPKLAELCCVLDLRETSTTHPPG